MNEEKFQALYKNTKKEEIIKELYFKCKANYELENIIKEVREYIKELKSFKIKYVMFEEKELYASENDFVNDILEILDKVEENK